MSITTSEQSDKVSKALVAAQHEFGGVEKGATNSHDRYKYAQLEDYIVAANSALAKYKLAVLTGAPEIESLPDRSTKAGSVNYAVRVKLDLRLVHESGQWMQVSCWGEGQDRADKALYKAITGARKYGLACLLGMVTTDDPERDLHVGLDDPDTKSVGRRETAPRSTGTNGKASGDDKKRIAFRDAIQEWSQLPRGDDLISACKGFAKRLGVEPGEDGKLSAANCGVLAKAALKLLEEKTDFAEYMAAEPTSNGAPHGR